MKIDPNGMFDNYFDAYDYANEHHIGFENIHFAYDKGEFFVAFGTNGGGYASGGTLIRDFGPEGTEMETIVANINNTIDGATNVRKLGENVSIGTNGKFYGINKGPFYGNQYVSVTNVYPIASKVYKGCTLVTIGLAGIETHNAYNKDGRKIGNNTKNALGKNISSYSAAYIGGYYGAEFGTCLCPGWGTFIGGMIGAVAGGIGGERIWQWIKNDFK